MNKRFKLSALTGALVAAGISGGAQAANWEFQINGINAIYDFERVFSADSSDAGCAPTCGLGVANPITGTFPVLRDNGFENGNQEFGNFAKADPVTSIFILKDGAAYGWLFAPVAVDFRLVLRTTNSACPAADGYTTAGDCDSGPYTGDPLDFLASPSDSARIDTERSFFDVYTDNSGTTSWGIAIDTITTVEQDVTQSGGGSLGGDLSGQLFEIAGVIDPEAFQMPLTAVGLNPDESPNFGISKNLRADVGEPNLDEVLTVSFSLGNFNYLNAGCTDADPTEVACNNSDVTMRGTGEMNFEAAQVPAPASILLLGAGLVAMGGVARRRPQS